jgi:6-phosphogluconolactonase (cycloisomerase 2 family)
MTRIYRDRNRRPLQIVLAGLIVWLAQGILIDNGDMSNGTYAAGLAVQGPEDRTPIVIERPPLRFIRDPNPAFSAVAVNSEHNMLVVTDENLFQILEYDSREDTPPQARFTEPRRVISGLSTKAEMMCGVYIDPVTREIYVLNNDTQPYLPVFSLDARGDATPDRFLGSIRGFSLVADEERQELFVVNQEGGRFNSPGGQGGAVYVFRKQAENEEEPLRFLEGYDTQLEDPHGIALDTENNLMYVSNFGNVHNMNAETGEIYGSYELPSITVYPLNASGNTRPLRIIEGPATLLNWPAHMALHQERQELFVANDGDSSILIFDASAEGNAAPLRVIKGPNTGILHPPGIALDQRLDELFVASMGTPSVTVFPVTADGDIEPTRTIRGAPVGTKSLMIGNPGAVGYDTLRGEILVPN